MLVITKVIPLMVWKIDTSDMWSHLYDAKQIKRGKKIPKSLNKFFPEVQFTYPYGISYILSLINEKQRKPLFLTINLLLHGIEVLTASLLVYKIVGIEYLYVAVAAYICWPKFFLPWTGLYGISARVIGAVICNINIISFILYYESSEYLYLIIPFLTSPLLILFSKFSVQVTIIYIIFLSFYYQSLIPISIIFVSFIIFNILLKNELFKILKGHLLHSVFYFKYLQKSHIATTKRTKSLIEFLISFTNISNKKSLFLLLYHTPCIRILLFNPFLILILSFYISEESYVFEIFDYLLIYSLSLCFIFSYSKLRFIGEADRYFTFSTTIITAIILSKILKHDQSYLYPLIILLIFSFLISVSIIIFKCVKKKTVDINSSKEVAYYLDNNIDTVNNIIVSPQNITEKIIYFSKCTFVGMHTNITSNIKEWNIYYSLFKKTFPFVSCEIEYLKKELNVKYFVVSKHYLCNSYLETYDLSLSDVTKPTKNNVFENKDYIIYEL